MHRKVYFRWEKRKERERERELLALVQFEVFSGQYLISTNRTKNDVTTIVYDRLRYYSMFCTKFFQFSLRKRYHFFDSNSVCSKTFNYKT